MTDALIRNIWSCSDATSLLGRGLQKEQERTEIGCATKRPQNLEPGLGPKQRPHEATGESNRSEKR